MDVYEDTCPRCRLRMQTRQRGANWHCPPCDLEFPPGALRDAEQAADVTVRLLQGLPDAALDLPSPTAVLPETAFDRCFDLLEERCGAGALFALHHLRDAIADAGGAPAYEQRVDVAW